MADSAFWRDLAVEFLALHWDLRADWQYKVGSGVLGNWTFRGKHSLRVQFESLARRAAMGLVEKRSPDLLIAWLEAIREDGTGFELAHSFPFEQNDDGSRGSSYLLGSIDGVGEASANFCRKFESEALQVEFEEEQQSKRPESQPMPAPPEPKSIGEQIRRLREECRLTIEDLASKVGIEPRSIQRHESNRALPHPRHVAAYERVFSKLLKTQIVISKTS